MSDSNSHQQQRQPPTQDSSNPPQSTSEIDASLEVDLDMSAPSNPNPSALNLDGANSINDSSSTLAPSLDPIAQAPDPRMPTKKDASLREFLGKMDEYAPIIPDAVTNYYLTLAGLPPPPLTSPHLARLLALSTQKFIADIAADAYQYSRIRSSNTTSNNPMTGLGGAAGLPNAGVANNTTGTGGGGAGGNTTGGNNTGGGGGKEGAGQGKALTLGVQRPGFGGGGQAGGPGRTVLTMEDLGMAVGEYGVNVRRGEFYR
ncbi:MAG: hypothetical protein M1812_001999 [Candelaria pacifica]|nr:MAG: hypothetical protein M1812_001999 [Candelaria pacifica]